MIRTITVVLTVAALGVAPAAAKGKCNVKPETRKKVATFLCGLAKATGPDCVKAGVVAMLRKNATHLADIAMCNNDLKLSFAASSAFDTLMMGMLADCSGQPVDVTKLHTDANAAVLAARISAGTTCDAAMKSRLKKELPALKAHTDDLGTQWASVTTRLGLKGARDSAGNLYLVAK